MKKESKKVKKIKNSEIDNSLYTPIKCLSTFNYDWRIKARVTKKHEVKTWVKPKQKGQILKIELMDDEGTRIEATFFNDAVDAFDQIIKE